MLSGFERQKWGSLISGGALKLIHENLEVAPTALVLSIAVETVGDLEAGLAQFVASASALHRNCLQSSIAAGVTSSFRGDFHFFRDTIRREPVFCLSQLTNPPRTERSGFPQESPALPVVEHTTDQATSSARRKRKRTRQLLHRNQTRE
jgi:hypothetical protein